MSRLGRRRLAAYLLAYFFAWCGSVGVGMFVGSLWAQIAGAFVTGTAAMFFTLRWAYRVPPFGLEIVMGPSAEVDPTELGWEPPRQRRGDKIIEGSICRPDGTTERIVLLVQARRHMITGLDRPIIITPGSHLHATVGGEEELPKVTTTDEPRRHGWLWL